MPTFGQSPDTAARRQLRAVTFPSQSVASARAVGIRGGDIDDVEQLWRTEIHAYCAWAVAAGHSAATIRLRRGWLERLAARAPRPPATCQLDDLITMLAVTGWRPETRKSARAALRSFYRFTVDTDRRPDDPTRRLPTIHVPPAVPRPAPDQIIAAALERASHPDHRLMLLLGTFQGLRCCEIAALRVEDLAGDQLVIRGKGGRVRVIPVHPLIADALRGREPGWVFPGAIDGHWAPQSVSRRIGTLLGPGWSAHKLRHRFASRAYAAGRDIRAVQELLGHAKLETTQIYTAVPDGALRAAVAGAASIAA